jgi:hypothetical protein
MKRPLILSSLSLVTCLLLACTPAKSPTSSSTVASATTAPTQLSSNPSEIADAVANTDIRPNSKGQRLEAYGSVDGEFSLPAGTSTFLVQSQLSYLNLDLLLGAPAYAQTSEELTDAQIREFKARIDDESVDMAIDKITRAANGDRIVSYYLKQVPVLEINQVLEFFSPSETINLKGILPQIKANTRNRLDTRIDLDSTAVVEVIQRDDNSVVHLITPVEIAELAKKPSVIVFRDFLKQQIKNKDNAKQPLKNIIDKFDVNKNVLPKLRENIDDLNAKQLKQCAQNPAQCVKVFQQCRPTLLKACPKPEDRVNQAQKLPLRPGILIPRAGTGTLAPRPVVGAQQPPPGGAIQQPPQSSQSPRPLLP